MSTGLAGMRHIGARRLHRVTGRMLVMLALVGGALRAQEPAREALRGVAMTTSPASVAMGSCSTVYLALKDSTGKDAPRNRDGVRISMADFDMTASGAAGNAVVGNYSGASAFSVCACQAAVVGSKATVTAKYPGASVVERRMQVEGVVIETSVNVPLVAPLGRSQPAGCESIEERTTATETQPGATTTTLAPAPVTAVALTSATAAGGTPLAESAEPAGAEPAAAGPPPIGMGAINSPTVVFSLPAPAALLTVDGSSSSVEHVAGGGGAGPPRMAAGAAPTRLTRSSCASGLASRSRPGSTRAGMERRPSGAVRCSTVRWPARAPPTPFWRISPLAARRSYPPSSPRWIRG